MMKHLKGILARKFAARVLKEAKIFAKSHRGYCRLAVYSYASQSFDDPNKPLTIDAIKASSYINTRYQNLIEESRYDNGAKSKEIST